MLEPFRPEPYSDFTDPVRRASFEKALASVETSLGAHHRLVIGGEERETGRAIVSVDPSRPSRVVGTVAATGVAEAQEALEAAWAAFPSWGSLDAGERARLGVGLATLMRERKYQLSALLCFEAGKNWLEAEADVCEAIDFCDYYARQALRLAEPLPVVPYPGEANESRLIPMGAGVVIPPWNFPLAILAGMAMGPVLAGNTVVLKPASATPVIGAVFARLVDQAGFPPGVVNFIPGSGAEVGDFLVDCPLTRFITFTGSREVGVRIAERSARVHSGQRWLKRAYMEMGGKDAMIVDETADLAAATRDAIRSAYGFQGQKCSAASRLILVDGIYDEVLERVVAEASSLEVGPAALNFPVGPVITAAQHQSILAEIDKGKSEALLACGGDPVEIEGGYFIRPAVFAGVPPRSRLGQHEIFGPVLSVIRATDFDQALAIANDTDFGLTGGLYSRDRDRIERARNEFQVGNLYINRKITGALVGVQPFGGFKMSGSNAKAGGPDYLRLFMEMKSVSERYTI
jgi:1-pyrroline-5-carboxylate dehydrogenase